MELRRIEFNSQSVKVNPAAAVLFFTFWKDQVTPVLSFSRRVRERLLIIIHSVPYIARSQLSFEKYHKVIRSSRRSRRRRIELKEHYTHKKYYKAREIKIIKNTRTRAALSLYLDKLLALFLSLSLFTSRMMTAYKVPFSPLSFGNKLKDFCSLFTRYFFFANQ